MHILIFRIYLKPRIFGVGPWKWYILRIHWCLFSSYISRYGKYVRNLQMVPTTAFCPMCFVFFRGKTVLSWHKTFFFLLLIFKRSSCTKILKAATFKQIVCISGTAMQASLVLIKRCHFYKEIKVGHLCNEINMNLSERINRLCSRW